MASEELGTEFLCDILYTDRERLSSYLAQIDPSGIITGYKTSTTGSSGIASTIKGDAAVASLSATGTLANQEFAERTFDPAGALPIEVMNRLDESNFIHRSVKNASIGSLVLVGGTMSLKDFSQFISIWPVIKKMVPWKNFAAQVPNPPHGSTVTATDIETSAKALLESMPYPLQMTLKGAEGDFWSTLADDNFIISPVDLFLKHNKSLPGEWFVLGVLDGEPQINNENTDGDNEEFLLDDIHDLVGSFKSIFGRPNTCHGISPLVIFRKIRRT